jgi:hypothetical protein
MFRIRTLFWVIWWALCGRLSARRHELYVADFNYRGSKFSIHRFDMRKHWHEKYL